MMNAGIGIRTGHYSDLLDRGYAGECAEVVTENFAGRGGRPRAVLEQVRASADVFFHGVSLSLGGLDPLDEKYLRTLDELCRDFQPTWVSDHLCFGTFGGQRAYDLWPLPYTDEAARHVVERIRRVQDRLKRRIAIENVSAYVEYQSSDRSEWDFLAHVLAEADCSCLLDVNNVFVSSRNQGFNPEEYLRRIDPNRVAYFHLAGHEDQGTHLLDDHGSEVSAAVWNLYRVALDLFGPYPTIVEWDSNLPALDRVYEEAERARQQQHLWCESRARMRAPWSGSSIPTTSISTPAVSTQAISTSSASNAAGARKAS